MCRLPGQIDIYPEWLEYGQGWCPPCCSCYAAGWQKYRPPRQTSPLSIVFPARFAMPVDGIHFGQPVQRSWQDTPALSYPIQTWRFVLRPGLIRTPQTFPTPLPLHCPEEELAKRWAGL